MLSGLRHLSLTRPQFLHLYKKELRITLVKRDFQCRALQIKYCCLGPIPGVGWDLACWFLMFRWCSCATRIENYQTRCSWRAPPALILWKLPHKIQSVSAQKSPVYWKAGGFLFLCLFWVIWNVWYILSSHLSCLFLPSFIHSFI